MPLTRSHYHFGRVKTTALSLWVAQGGGGAAENWMELKIIRLLIILQDSFSIDHHPFTSFEKIQTVSPIAWVHRHFFSRPHFDSDTHRESWFLSERNKSVERVPLWSLPLVVLDNQPISVHKRPAPFVSPKAVQLLILSTRASRGRAAWRRCGTSSLRSCPSGRTPSTFSPSPTAGGGQWTSTSTC